MRAKLVVAGVLLAVLLSSCGGIILLKPSVEEIKVITPAIRLSGILRHCQTKADSVQVLEWEALFQIIDPGFCKTELLLQYPDRETLSAHIEDYKQVIGTEQWDEIMSRRALARITCKTTIFHQPRDIRWDLLLMYGFPSVEWVSKGEILEPGTFFDGIPCDYYTFIWDTWDIEVVCRSGPRGEYPIEIVPKQSRDHFELRTWINSSLYFAGFPNADNTFDLWVCTQTTTDQLTDESLIKGELFLKFTVSDSADNLVGCDTLRANIRLLRAMVGIANDYEYAALGYLGCRNLPAGNYQVAVDIQGEGNNAGHYTKTILLPSPYSSRGTSDILLVLPDIISRPNITPGITRGERVRYGIARLVISKGNDIYPYWELDLPADSNIEYLVSAILVPIPVQQKGKGKVIVESLAYIEDTEGRPWMNSSPPPELLKKKVGKKIGKYAKKDVRIVLNRVFHYTNNTSGVFEVPLSLRTVSRGNYWLVLRVSDLEEEYYFRTAWLPIVVR